MSTNRDLDSQLDAYEAQAGSVSRSNRRRARWAAYAAAAGSALAGTTAAEAEIIYSGPKDLSASAAPGSHFSAATFKFGPASAKFSARASMYLRTHGSHGGSVALQGGSGNRLLSNASFALKRLASGAKISGTNIRSKAALYRTFHNPHSNGGSGTWKAGKPGFAGVEFKANSKEYFGWVKMSWNKTSKGGDSITVLGWAYNNVAGGPIMAGQVPEPSTALMGLLATGCGGVLAWRRKRRALAESAVSAD